MNNDSATRIESLEEQEKELTPEQAAEAQGGGIQLTRSAYYADPRNLEQLSAHPTDPIPSN